MSARRPMPDGFASPMFPRIADIQYAVCRQFDVRPEQIHSQDRCRHITRPRQVVMYLARRMTIRSFGQIGQFFDRDHTTVMHACSSIAGLRRADPELNDAICAVVEYLNGDAR